MWKFFSLLGAATVARAGNAVPRVLGVSKMLSQVVDQLQELKATTKDQKQDAHLAYETSSAENTVRRNDMREQVKQLRENLDALAAELQLKKNEQAVAKVNLEKLEAHKKDTQEQLDILKENYDTSEDDNKKKGQQMAELITTLKRAIEILEGDGFGFIQTGAFMARKEVVNDDADASLAAEAAAESERLASDDAAASLKARLQDPLVKMELGDDDSMLSEKDIDALVVPTDLSDDETISEVSESTTSSDSTKSKKKFMGSKKQWVALIDALHAITTEPALGASGFPQEAQETAKRAIVAAVQSSTGQGEASPSNNFGLGATENFSLDAQEWASDSEKDLQLSADNLGINFSSAGQTSDSILDMLKDMRNTLEAQVIRLLQDQSELLKRYSSTKAAMDSVLASTKAGIEQLQSELAKMKADIEGKNTQKNALQNDYDAMSRTLAELEHIMEEQKKSYEAFSEECTTIIRAIEKGLLQLDELMGKHANLREPVTLDDGSEGGMFTQAHEKIQDGKTKDAFKDEDLDEMNSNLSIGEHVAMMAAPEFSTSANPDSEKRYELFSQHQLGHKPSELAKTLAMLQAPIKRKVAMLQAKKPANFNSMGANFNPKKAAQEIEKERASDYLKLEAKQLGSLGLGQLATRVAAEPFEKVRDLIQRLIDTLKTQRDEEVSKHTWCDEQTSKLENQLEAKEMNVDEAQVKHDDAYAKFHANKNGIDDVMKQKTDLAEQEWQTTKQFQAEKERLAAEVKDLAAVIQDLDTIIGDMQNTEADTLDGKLTPIIEVLKWVRNQLQNAHSDSEIQEKEIEHAHDTNMSEFRVLEQKLEIALKEKQAQAGFLESAMLNDKTSLEEHEALLAEAQKYHETLVKNCATPVETWEQRNDRRQQEIDALKEALEILQGHTDAMNEATAGAVVPEAPSNDDAGSGDLVVHDDEDHTHNEEDFIQIVSAFH